MYLPSNNCWNRTLLTTIMLLSQCTNVFAEVSDVNQAVKSKSESTAAATGQQVFEVVDVEGLQLQSPANTACKTFVLDKKPTVIDCDVVIVGGGMGGLAAANSLVRLGANNVCLLEETSWLGGQMTSQGVSALDENALVESTGACRSYKELRDNIRKRYKELGATDGGARFEPWLDPGNCWVSRLAFEPKVGLDQINKLIEQPIRDRKLKLFLRSRAVATKIERQKIRSVLSVNLDTGNFIEFRCRFCIDATELGDVLPLVKLAYSTGAESRLETGEAHAPLDARPDNVQDFTYPFVVEFRKGESHTTAKPPLYDEFKSVGKFSFNGYRMFDCAKLSSAAGSEYELLPFWEYRRLIAASNFPEQTYPNDIAMINWDSNDLRGQNIIDKPPLVVAERLSRAKWLSLGFLYWLQTEAPRDEGGTGYPELMLRADIMGTNDGLSKFPYIRESRRLRTKYTIVESDIVVIENPGPRARNFDDTLGIGHYPVDIHGIQDVPGAGQATRPFQIPAGAFIQSKVRNFLPAAKNIGTTHITNGAYRLHPIEWAIGEAAGVLAFECMQAKKAPTVYLKNHRRMRTVQQRLIEQGAPLVWFDDLPPEHHAFAAGQFLALTRLMPPDQDSLHFRPEELLTRGELCFAMARLLHLSKTSDLTAAESIELCRKAGLLREDVGDVNAPISPLDLIFLSMDKRVAVKASVSGADNVSRAAFALWLYQVARAAKFFGRH